MIDLSGYRMPFGYREIRGNRDIHLGAQAMAKPSCPHLRHIFHSRDVSHHMSNLLYYLWFYSVEEAGKDGLS